MLSLDDIDPDFVKDLAESERAVSAVADWYRNTHGLKVIVPPVSVRPTSTEMDAYADDGDLEIVQRVEVKRRPDIDFKTLAEFPYDPIIVDTVRAHDMKYLKPNIYLILNKSMTAAILVRGSTRQRWTKGYMMSKKRGREREYYLCPKALAEFFVLGNSDA